MRVILLLLLMLPCGIGLAADALRALQQYYDSVHTLSGRFVQKTHAEDGARIDASSGELALARPNRFDWFYEKPYRQRIVADGKRLWVYDVELRQVTVKPLDDVLGVGPAQLLSGRFSDLQRSFKLKDLGDGWLGLLPKTDQWEFQRVRLHMAHGVPDVLEIEDGLGQTTHLELHDLQRNPKFDPQRFHFTPPQGVDVIGTEHQAAAPQ